MKIYLRKKRIRIIVAALLVAVALVLIFGNVFGHWWTEVYRILRTWEFDSENKNVKYGQVVFVGEDNRIERITTYEKHGLLRDMA